MLARGSTMMPPVGKSGPGTSSTSFSMVALGCLMRCSSRRAQLVRRCAAGCWSPCRRRCPPSRWRAGSGRRPAARPAPRARRRRWGGSRPCPRRCRRAGPWRRWSGGSRCSAWPRRYRRRCCRSCPARRPAGSARRSPARGAPARRRSPGRRAGGTCRSRRRRRARTSCSRAGVEPELAHGVEDAPVHGLQAVAHVGQRAVHDGGERVGEVALLQRLLEVDRLDGAGGRLLGGKAGSVCGSGGRGGWWWQGGRRGVVEGQGPCGLSTRQPGCGVQWDGELAGYGRRLRPPGLTNLHRGGIQRSTNPVVRCRRRRCAQPAPTGFPKPRPSASRQGQAP